MSRKMSPQADGKSVIWHYVRRMKAGQADELRELRDHSPISSPRWTNTDSRKSQQPGGSDYD
jgi:hypothetical protein